MLIIDPSVIGWVNIMLLIVAFLSLLIPIIRGLCYIIREMIDEYKSNKR